TTWAAILTFNATAIPFIDQLTYSRSQIDAKIAALTVGGLFAPKDARFIVQIPDAGLPNAQALSALSNGLLKNQLGTIAIATAGGDYQAPIIVNAPLTFNTNVLAIPAANGSTNGYLSASDWTNFNGKQAALGFTPENLANKNATSGYAGLSSGKVALSQISEVIGLQDLSDVSGALGTGSTV